MEFIIFAVLCIGFMTAFNVIRCIKGAGPLAVMLKSLASISFVFGGIYACYKNGLTVANLIIVFGLIFAMVGDIILDLKVAYKEHEEFYLNSGMATFSLSSICYIVATIVLWSGLEGFLVATLGAAALALIFALIVILLAPKLKLNLSGYRAQVFVYSTAVAMAAILSLFVSFYVPYYAIFAVGIFLVLISDLILSLMYFGGKENSGKLCVINHVIYYLGELLVVAYLFFQLGKF